MKKGNIDKDTNKNGNINKDTNTNDLCYKYGKLGYFIRDCAMHKG